MCILVLQEDRLQSATRMLETTAAQLADCHEQNALLREERAAVGAEYRLETSSLRDQIATLHSKLAASRREGVDEFRRELEESKRDLREAKWVSIHFPSFVGHTSIPRLSCVGRHLVRRFVFLSTWRWVVISCGGSMIFCPPGDGSLSHVVVRSLDHLMLVSFP